MIDPKLYYKTFLTDHYRLKLKTWSAILANVEKFEVDFFSRKLRTEEKEDYIRTIRGEIRQSYFQSIETVFEIIFALDPTSHSPWKDEAIMQRITASNQQKNFERIRKIASEEDALDFMKEEITTGSDKISAEQYLFYYGFIPKKKELKEAIQSSLSAIKFGLKIIAHDFTKREEYNSYKHGLRIIPALKEITFLDADTLNKVVSWDLSNSMSFFLRTKDPKEVKIQTKLFDTDRDFNMGLFCSNLIFNLIHYRKIHMFPEEKKDKIPLPIFGKEAIEKACKINVSIQDLHYTLKEVSN